MMTIKKKLSKLKNIRMKPQWKKPLAILAGTLIILAGYWYFFLHVDQSTPRSVTEGFLKLVKNSSWRSASRIFVEPEKSEKWKQWFEEKKIELLSYEITKLQEEGEEGYAKFKYKYLQDNKEYSSSGSLDLKKIDGSWYVVSASF